MRSALAAASLLAAALTALPAAAGVVSGRVTLAVAGAHLADLGPTVIFLENQASAPSRSGLRERATIRQHNARFEPDFLVITAGDSVRMPNDDTIFHNVFSFSKPNDFDLGVYPAGESRSVTFRHPGLVKIYCSIHESMSAAVLVSPSPWFATAEVSGEYRIADVPPGRYRLTVWNEKLPPVTRTVQVASRPLRADVALAAAEP